MQNRNLLPAWYAAEAGRLTERRALALIRAQRIRRHIQAREVLGRDSESPRELAALDALRRAESLLDAISRRKWPAILRSAFAARHIRKHGAPTLALAAQIAARRTTA